jgi:hypothetical protein
MSSDKISRCGIRRPSLLGYQRSIGTDARLLVAASSAVSQRRTAGLDYSR